MKDSMTDLYPLPWRHETDGKKMSAVVAANGVCVCGSLVCEQSSPRADREAHEFIVRAADNQMWEEHR